MIHPRVVRFPFHTGRSRAKMQQVIASDYPGKFRRQPALNDNPAAFDFYLTIVSHFVYVYTYLTENP